MTNEFILTNYITNYITNYTEITNFGLNSNTIYNLTKTSYLDVIIIPILIALISCIIPAIALIASDKRNRELNKKNDEQAKEINKQNKISKYFYTIQYNFKPYIEKINDVCYNFKVSINSDNIKINILNNIKCYTSECIKYIENLETNLELIKEDIYETHKIYAVNLKNINNTLNKIYDKTILIKDKSTESGYVSDQRFELIEYKIFFGYFELVRKYVNTIILSINMEISSGIININKVDYNEIADKEKEVIKILNEYPKKV